MSVLQHPAWQPPAAPRLASTARRGAARHPLTQCRGAHEAASHWRSQVSQTAQIGRLAHPLQLGVAAAAAGVGTTRKAWDGGAGWLRLQWTRRPPFQEGFAPRRNGGVLCLPALANREKCVLPCRRRRNPAWRWAPPTALALRAARSPCPLGCLRSAERRGWRGQQGPTVPPAPMQRPLRTPAFGREPCCTSIDLAFMMSPHRPLSQAAAAAQAALLLLVCHAAASPGALMSCFLQPGGRGGRQAPGRAGSR